MARRDAARDWARQAGAPREARLLRDDRQETFGRNVSGQFEPSSPLVGRPARRGAGAVPFVQLPLGELVYVRAAAQAGFADDGTDEMVWSDVSGDRTGFFTLPAALPTASLPYTGVAAPVLVIIGIQAADGQVIPAGTRVEVRRDGAATQPAFEDDVQWRQLSDAATFEPVGVARMLTGSVLSVAIVAPEGQTVDIAGAWMTLQIPDPFRLQRPDLPPPEMDTGDVMWWLSQSILNLDDDEVLPSWPDSGPHNIMPDVFGSPVYVESGINGRPAVRFNGTTTRVSALNKFPANVCNSCSTTAACWAVVAVVQLADVGKNQLVLGNSQGGGTQHRFGFGDDNRLQVGNHSDPLVSTNPVADTGVHIISGRAHSSNGLLRFDGTTVASGPAPATALGHCGSLNVRSPQVGATGFHHSFLDGLLGDAVVLDNPSDSRIAEWEAHFASEYDL